jgi:hypothetical protein
VINRLFAALILAPPLIWLAALAFVTVLGRGFGCEINGASAQSCVALGLELAGVAYNTFLFAAWGPLILFPFAIAALLGFGLVALLRAALRKARGAAQLSHTVAPAPNPQPSDTCGLR